MTVVVERPATEAELVAVVKRAAAGGRPVRVGPVRRPPRGSGDEVLIDLSGYGRILRVDRAGGEATVETGVSLGRLGVGLGSWGLSLENGGRRPGQSLGAAVSLGAHGTGARWGGMATQVRALRLITPDGTVISCSADQERDIFNAARVGRGALGVISTVTLRCRPGFNLRAQVASVDLDEALANFDRYADGNDHFELSWLPGRARARVVTANRTDEPADGGAVDRCYRWWNRRRVWAPKIEYSFPRPESGPALQRAKALSAVGRPGPPNGLWGRPGPFFPIEVSVTAGDDIPLSPAEGGPSVYIGGVNGLDGRPQWGSPHGVGPAALRVRYPRWDEWQAVRDRLDPDRRFAHSSGQG